ncbi:DUF1253-domain-containing protein [Meredithblackwellia eburnea MCA 4105]
MKEMTEQSASTKLLTIINVDQARPSKRKRASARDWQIEASTFLKKRATSGRVGPVGNAMKEVQGKDGGQEKEEEEEEEETLEDDGEEEQDRDEDIYERHWSSNSPLVSAYSSEKLSELKWKKSKGKGKQTIKALGDVSLFLPDVLEETKAIEEEGDLLQIYNPNLLQKLKDYNGTAVLTSPQKSLLETLASYRDVLYPKVDITKGYDTTMRAPIALHAMNHVLKTRNRVLKNNDHLAKLSSGALTTSTPDRVTTDQGFTRPKVLILCPFRNSAQSWVSLLTSLSLFDSIENKSRFDGEYSLPEGAVDKLLQDPGRYTKDHVETFKGNIDDSFRLGLKVTRKTCKLFAEFYSCDVIVASPLGLRTSIEKEKGDADFLSSIELLVVDQMDVMLMQNWDHVQFVMDRLNKLPTEAHGCDFSRVKPWYLDGKAAFLRQSVLLSAYETPEIRALFNTSLTNVAGKIKAEPENEEGVLADVPKGVKQVWTRFETNDVYAEDDARFEHFTTKTLPMLLKSAVSSSQTIIFVPSYFDFVRLKRYLKKLDNFNFTSISEYSSTPEISRARGAFFGGKVDFLLITERFHFFRRYRIRGAKTFVFYAPPDHAAYYPEILSFPFKKEDGEPEVDESELSCQVVFSKFDFLRLERICGKEDARKMAGGGPDATRFTFL